MHTMVIWVTCTPAYSKLVRSAHEVETTTQQYNTRLQTIAQFVKYNEN